MLVTKHFTVAIDSYGILFPYYGRQQFGYQTIPLIELEHLLSSVTRHPFSNILINSNPQELIVQSQVACLN